MSAPAEEAGFPRSSHSTRALVDRRVANASNPKDIQVGLTVEQVQFTKTFVVDALLGSIGALGREHTSAWHYTRQRTIATAASYFWRFYLKHSFCDHEPTAIAVVCVSLASKVEENPVHKHEKLTKDLARALRKCVYDEEAELEEDRLLALELVVMEELGFNLSVFDPYTPLQKFLKNASHADADVLSTAWGLLNDSLDGTRSLRFASNTSLNKRIRLDGFPCSAVGWRGEGPCHACTPLCVMIPPEEIAIAAIRVAVELLEKDPPPALRRAGFDVNHDDVVLACREILEYYKFPPTVFKEDGGAAKSGRPGVEGNGGGRQQFLRQHRHEVAAFILACREGGTMRNF